MSYFLILDGNAPVCGVEQPAGTRMDIVASSPNLGKLIGISSFTELENVDVSGLTFVHLRSVDLADASVNGNPLVPAAYYSA